MCVDMSANSFASLVPFLFNPLQTTLKSLWYATKRHFAVGNWYFNTSTNREQLSVGELLYLLLKMYRYMPPSLQNKLYVSTSILASGVILILYTCKSSYVSQNIIHCEIQNCINSKCSKTDNLGNAILSSQFICWHCFI